MLSVPIDKAWPPASSPPPALPTELSNQAAALQSVVRALIAHVVRERRDHPDVEDATHEVFRRALEGRDRLRPGEPVRPWVLGIARHVAIDVLRQRGRAIARRAREAPQQDDVDQSALDRVADEGPGPESQAQITERARALQHAMTTLAPEQRQALLLFHVEGLGYGEIAEELAVPVGTVGTWITRGRRNLAAALDKETKKS